MENNKYFNSFFDLEILLPQDWVVQSKEKSEEIAKLGKDIAVGDDNNLKAEIEASEINSANLLAVFEYEVGAAVDYNPSFVLVAENLINAPGVKNGSDYLFQTRKLLKQSQMHYAYIDEEFEREVINDQEFYSMNCHIEYMGFHIYQKYFSTIQNGFCISAIISFVDEEQKNDLEQIVEAIVFDK